MLPPSPFAGIIFDTTPKPIAEGQDSGMLVVRYISLYNPNAIPTEFLLRLVVEEGDALDSNLILTRFDARINATSTWRWGDVGTPIMLLPPGHRYEVVLDTTPTLGIHYVVDCGRVA